MLIHPHSRVAARGLLSLALLSGIGLERAGLAGEQSGRAPRPAAAPAAEAEGIVHIWRSPEPEGIASLRHMPHVGRWIAWLMPGGFVIAAVPTPPSAGKESTVVGAPNELLKSNGRRAQYLEDDIQYFPASEEFLLPNTVRARQEYKAARAGGRSVMVAPLDSCTPVDVGRIEDLIFPDPATADRIIRAAGQGFRVVVLSPVADPTPNLHSQDCPRPSAADQPAADHPEPTPVAFEREGRVRITRPFGALPAAEPVPAAPVPELFTDAIPILKKLPGITNLHRTAPTPAAPKLLVPHPAPVLVSQRFTGMAIGPAPASTGSELSPSEHLRLAASQLSDRGLTAEAQQLRDRAKELDDHVERRLKAIEKQQQGLAAEAAKLKRLQNSQRQIQLRAEIVEVDLRRLDTEEGAALLRKHLADELDTVRPLGEQLATAVLSPGFLSEAKRGRFLTRLSSPSLVTTDGQEATIQVGAEVPVPDGATGELRGGEFGIHLSTVPSRTDDNRIRLDVIPTVRLVDWSNSVTVAGRLVPGVWSRRTNTQVVLSPGQSVALGGFSSAISYSEGTGIQQTAGERTRSRDPNYEILFIVTPERVSRPDDETPSPPKASR